MKTTYRATLRLHQDAAIGDGRAGDQLRTTRDHVPGWVLRGALAAAWIRAHDAPTPENPRRHEFVALFEGADAVRFNSLYALGAPRGLSALVHKHERGCRKPYDALDYEEHRVPTMCECAPTLAVPLEPTKGDVPRVAGGLRRDFSAALGKEETAVTGQLFGVESIDSEAMPELAGFITCTPQDRVVLESLGGAMIIGGSGSTKGMATLTLEEGGSPDTDRFHLQGDSARLILKLASPALFVDELGRPAELPDLAELEEALGVPVRRDRPVRKWIRWTTEGGWHGASGLPKPTERCVSAGSTYMITLAQRPPEEALARLASRGLGLRRYEGFGSLLAEVSVDPAAVERERVAATARAVADQWPPSLPPAARADLAKDLRSYGQIKSADQCAVPPPGSRLERLLRGQHVGLKSFLSAAVDLGAEALLALADLLEES